MTTQTPSTEERLSRLEGAYEQVSERLNELARGLSDLRSDMNSRFNVMLVLLGGVWATVVAGFIALFARL